MVRRQKTMKGPNTHRFLEFRPVDVSREGGGGGGGGSERNVHGTFLVTKSIGESSLTYGHPEGSAAGDITIIWNDVFKW